MRVIGIDDGPFTKFRHGAVIVVGTIFRGGQFLDGVVSTHCRVDGADSTRNIAAMINKCKFKSQLRLILLHGVAVGGFNIIDIPKLHKETRLPVLVVVRDYPDFEVIFKTLRNLGFSRRVKLIKQLPKPKRYGLIYAQAIGLTDREVKDVLAVTTSHALIPEALRVAHLIAAGVVKGESSGRA